MRNGSQSQVSGSSGNLQGSPQNWSQDSPLMDNSHGTSGSTGTGTGMGSVGMPLGAQASDDEEDSLTPVEEVVSRKRKPKWLQDTLRELLV